jgi:hypothetical protein
MGTNFQVANTGNTRIGTGAFDASAALTINSTTQGFLLPRLTTGERDAISSPTSGLVIYNTTSGELNVRGASAWVPVGSTAFPLLAPDGTAGAPSYSFSSDSDTGIYRIGANTIGISTNSSEKFRIDTANVTIGVTPIVPADRALQIAGASNTYLEILNPGSNPDWNFKSNGTTIAHFHPQQIGFLVNSAAQTAALQSTGWIVTGAPIVATTTSNQLALSGPTRQVFINAPQPATASRTMTIPDVGSNADFLLTNGTQTVNKTLFWNTGDLYTFLGALSAPGLALNGTDKTSGLTGGGGGHNIIIVAHQKNAIEADGDANTVVVGSLFDMGVGGSPVTNGILTVNSTTKAFVPPRMTSAQRDAIGSPTAGMVVYNTTDNLVSFYNGTSWDNLAAGGVSYPLLAPDGTAGAPSYSFSSDSNTGLYRIGNENLGFSANGALVFQYDTTGVYPNADNTKDLGSASLRWNDIYGVTLHSGDIELDNKWRITEGDKVGHPEEGVMLLSPTGKKYKINMTEVE